MADRKLSRSEFDQRFQESFGFSSLSAFHWEIKSWPPMPCASLFEWLEVADMPCCHYRSSHLRLKLSRLRKILWSNPQLEIEICAQKSKFQKRCSLSGGKKQASGQVSQVKRFFEIWKVGTHLQEYGKGKEESNLNQPLWTQLHPHTYMCSLRHPSKILKVQHSIWELRITTAQQEMYNNLGAFRD